MFISPKKAIEEGWISEPPNADHIQPNAIDITADKIFKVNETNTFSFSSEGKTYRNREEIINPSVWKLEKGIYDIVSNYYVELPPNVAGYLITRSTLNRNGVFIQSGLYDSGYKGPVQCMLYNLFGETILEPHIPVAQFVFVDSASHSTYKGGYNTSKGILPDYIQDSVKKDRERWSG